MSDFAFTRIYRLVQDLDSTTSEDEREAKLRYICALFSELAYFHIPEWEIDRWKRAKFFPSKALRDLCIAGKGKGGTNISSGFMQNMDMPRGFEVSTQGVVALGRVIDHKLFIGIRGTWFLHDWRINFRAKLTPVTLRYAHYHWDDIQTRKILRLHSGFAYEATRIKRLINEAIEKEGIKYSSIYLTGHSLGGAVAAILAELMWRENPRTITFGAPRYTGLSTYFDHEWDIVPTQIRIPADCVPILPPRCKGYIDPLDERSTNGKEYIDPKVFYGLIGNCLRVISFIWQKIDPHSMERYRKEVGRAIHDDGADLPFMDIEKIKFNDLKL